MWVQLHRQFSIGSIMSSASYDGVRISLGSFGGPEVLQQVSFTGLSPQADQVLVKVLAFGVNPVETYIRNGLYDPLPSLPYTPGTDAAGIIVSVGADVVGHQVGSRVWLTGALSGTYTQYAVCNPSDVHPLPSFISFEQGAALAVPYRTALRALSRIAEAKSGESVLVQGATGGVGIAALQISRLLGLTPIIASTSSTDASVHELLKANGANEVVRYGELKEGTKVDIIFENLANKNLGNDLKLLKRKGRVIVVGNRGETTINARDLMRIEGSIRGMMAFAGTKEERAQEDAVIQEALEGGKLSPVVGQVFKLGEIAAAHEEVISHSKGTRGKIVVLPFEV